MTRTANARVAGFTYLFYAAIGICLELVMHGARSGDGDTAAKLARIGGPRHGRAHSDPDYAARMLLGPCAGRDAVPNHARPRPGASNAGLGLSRC